MSEKCGNATQIRDLHEISSQELTTCAMKITISQRNSTYLYQLGQGLPGLIALVHVAMSAFSWRIHGASGRKMLRRIGKGLRGVTQVARCGTDVCFHLWLRRLGSPYSLFAVFGPTRPEASPQKKILRN